MTVVIGLTGTIGSGKSLAGGILAGFGAAIIDADLIAREIVEPNLPAAIEILEAFGSDYFFADGRLNRALLGEKIFNDPSARLKLNSITHPKIYAQAEAEIIRLRLKKVPLVFLEAAVLLEIGLNKLCDQIWLIVSDRELIIKRLAKRDNFKIEDTEARLNSQLNPKELSKHADLIINNNGDPLSLKQQLEGIVKENFGII